MKGLWTRLLSTLALCGSCVGAGAADGQGLSVDPEQLPWPRLQTRLSVQSPLATNIALGSRAAPSLGSLSVMSDYYVTPSFLGAQRAGGFRATGGLLVGPRGQAWPGLGTAPTLGVGADRHLSSSPVGAAGEAAPAEGASLPYVGIGYTGLSPRGGWSFSADLGMVSLSPGGAVKLGRVFNNSQTLDDTMRDMRWSPVLQVGVSYSF
ncbi:MAG TPA: hypothetical protein VMU47_08460 [Caldimonas sp.]|nr:hypothetical protein [Caldimonas sp.]